MLMIRQRNACSAGARRASETTALPPLAHLSSKQQLALPGTELAHGYVGTLRLKLLKIGAVIWRNTRRIRVLVV